MPPLWAKMGLLAGRLHAGLVTLRALISVMRLDNRLSVLHTWILVAWSSVSEVRVKFLKSEWAARQEISAKLTKDRILITHGKRKFSYFLLFRSFTHTQCRPEDMFGQSVCRQCCHQSYCNRGSAPGSTAAWFNPTAKYQSRVDWSAQRPWNSNPYCTFVLNYSLSRSYTIKKCNDVNSLVVKAYQGHFPPL